MAGIVAGCARGRDYRAARGQMTSRYLYRHATWNGACPLSGKVTVTASPCTGLAHHAHGRTEFSCLFRGRLAFAMLLSLHAFCDDRASHTPSPGHAFRLVREHEPAPLGQPVVWR